ncbi:MAG: elongation factor Tu [Methanomicrobiales archaeon]|nr:elongation factor Tu [Methanomicrobiales archaeon]
MGNLNIAVLGSAEYAARLGKKGTTSDITLYNFKRGEDTLTLIEPARYPERLSSLFYAVSLADRAVVVVDGLSPEFGEIVLMLDATGVQKGFIILRGYLSPDQVKRLVKGTVVEKYLFHEDNPVSLRELLLADAKASSPPLPGDTREMCCVPVDHFFPVRGIGVVVLGCVVRGTVLRHDTLSALPRGLSVLVRSIQRHDDDTDWAGRGDRVGLALKNIELEDLDRGDVLTNDVSLSVTSSLTGEVHLFPYVKHPIKMGTMVHVGHWMQFLPARVLAVDTGRSPHHLLITLATEKPLVHPAGGTAVVCFLDGGIPRVMGTVSLPGHRIIEKAPLIDR